MTKLLLTTLLLLSLQCRADNTVGENDANQRKPVSLTVRVPEAGVYAVSITDKDVITNDTLQPDIVTTMLDNSTLLKDISMANTLQYGFETQQIISGKVKRAFFKVRNPQIIVLNPYTGERQDYSLDRHQSFNLLGFDIQEKGTLILQATKENGKDGLVELVIKEPYFPQLSMAKQPRESIDFTLTPQEEERLALSAPNKDKKYFAEIELEEVVAEGKKYKPMNRYDHTPVKCFNYKDSILANGNSMDLVFSRLGYQIRSLNGGKSIGLYKHRSGGWSSRIEFVTPVIYIDEFRIDSIDEIWNLSPQDIKQIECFSGDQWETKFTLRSNEAGALCIYTKDTRPRRNPLSMKAVHPLGYRPSKKPYNPLDDNTYEASDDHRAMLYWNPALVVDSTCKAQITFMPSSTSRDYNVCLMGIGNTGEIACSTVSKTDPETMSEEQKQAVTDYLQTTPREKVYVQTDRSLYCAGDTVWFRVHIADALSAIPSTSPYYPKDRSKYVYAELHSNPSTLRSFDKLRTDHVQDKLKSEQTQDKKTDGTLVERIMIKQDELGVFSSYIVLPSQPTTDNYTLVAYTRHMLNFPEEHFFYKQIQVVSPR